MSFPPSTLYQGWVSSLRLRWASSSPILTTFAKLIGDLTVDWATQAVLESLPEFASPESVALIASERLIDAGPHESTADLAKRLTFAPTLWKFAGTPLGMLLALHFSEFDNAVLVQQNGRAYQLTLPLPPFVAGQDWDPTPNLVITPLSTLSVPLHSDKDLSRSIPIGNSWWTFDSDTDFCSRFAILFPGPLPSTFVTIGVATFTGAEDGTTVPWPLAVWNNPFPDTSYLVQPGLPSVSSGGPVSVADDLTTQTMASIRIAASGSFVGTVPVLAWQRGANPFADLHPADLARLRRVVSTWRPAKATCTGVSVLVQGNFIGWPVRTIGSAPPSPSTVVQYTGGF